jgi:hypothetical protein
MALSHFLWEDDVSRREKAVIKREEELTEREERLAKREEELNEKERRAKEGEARKEEEHHKEEEEHHEEEDSLIPYLSSEDEESEEEEERHEEEEHHEEEEERHEEEEEHHEEEERRKEQPRPKRQQKKRIFCQYLLEIDPSKKFYNTFRNKWVKIVEKAEKCGGEFQEKVKALDLISIRSIPGMQNELYKLGQIQITNEVMDAVAYLTKIPQTK